MRIPATLRHPGGVGIFVAGVAALAVGLSIAVPTATAFALTLGVTGVVVLGAMLLLQTAGQRTPRPHREVAHR